MNSVNNIAEELVNVLVSRITENVLANLRQGLATAVPESITEERVREIVSLKLADIDGRLETAEGDVDDLKSRMSDAEEVTGDIDGTVRSAVQNLSFTVEVN